MGKFIKSIVAGILSMSMVTWGVPVLAALEDSGTIPISVVISASGSYSIDVDTSSFTGFSPDFSTLTEEEGWVVGNGYVGIEVGTTTPMGTWGVRVITDNVDYLPTVYSGSVVGYPLVSDTAYGGLILIEDSDGDGTAETITSNPGNRAALAWQIYDAAPASTPTVPTDASFGSGDWDAPWAYLADESDTSYVTFVTTYGEDTAWYAITGGYALNYSAICYGNPTGVGLSSHPDSSFPAMTDNDSDGLYDARLYLAAKFANTFYYDMDGDGTAETPMDNFLPAGSYATNIYVELFTE